MALAEISALVQILGGIGVFASLIFVGVQIRENSKAVRSATAQAVHDNYAGWYMALAGDPLALATSAKGFVDLGSLTPPEKAQFVCIYMAFLSHCQNAFHQWKAGHLSDDLWKGWDVLMQNLNTQGGAAFWAERSYVFGEDFRDHFEKLMHRAPNPNAKAFGVVPLRRVTDAIEAGKTGSRLEGNNRGT